MHAHTFALSTRRLTPARKHARMLGMLGLLLGLGLLQPGCFFSDESEENNTVTPADMSADEGSADMGSDQGGQDAGSDADMAPFVDLRFVDVMLERNRTPDGTFIDISGAVENAGTASIEDAVCTYAVSFPVSEITYEDTLFVAPQPIEASANQSFDVGGLMAPGGETSANIRLECEVGAEQGERAEDNVFEETLQLN